MTPKQAAKPRWLLFIHQLPPTPAYLRVRVRRRLHSLGAEALKQTVYVLPETAEALEDLQWLRKEIEADGGSASIAVATFVDGPRPEAARRGRRKSAQTGRPRLRTWVTRKNVFVDRIASAWLIRRFIDAGARFRFVDDDARIGRGQLRFDMADAEYTHVGDQCTFETLLRRFELTDPALVAIGRIVHDIDLKDARYRHRETGAVEREMRAIIRRGTSDARRVTLGAKYLDELFAGLGR